MTTLAAHLVDARAVETLDVLGPQLAFLTSPDDADGAPLVMRGTIPPGGAVPLHSHAEPETFFPLSGEVEGLTDSPEGLTWVRLRPGDVFHVPGGAKHAFRNRSEQPSVQIIVSTARIGRFFREVAGPPTQQAIRHFLEVSERYGYWNATPEENAAVGLALP